MEKQLEKINDESVKKRLMSNFPFSLLSGPATENSKDKLKSNVDKDEVARRAGEIAARQAKQS